MAPALEPAAALDQDVGAVLGVRVDQVEVGIHEIVAVDVIVEVDGLVHRPPLCVREPACEAPEEPTRYAPGPITEKRRGRVVKQRIGRQRLHDRQLGGVDHRGDGDSLVALGRLREVLIVSRSTAGDLERQRSALALQIESHVGSDVRADRVRTFSEIAHLRVDRFRRHQVAGRSDRQNHSRFLVEVADA